MKLTGSTPPSLAQQLDQVGTSVSRPIEANAARMVQLAQEVQVPPGLSQADAIEQRAKILNDALPKVFGRPSPDEAILLQSAFKAQATLRASAQIVAEHTERLEAAAARGSAIKNPKAPTPEVAQAFLARFAEEGTKGGQSGAHNDWFVNMGPGSGKTFLFTPSAEAVETRAAQIAEKKGAPLADKHRLAAADELAKEQKVKFGDGPDAPGAAGRIFAAPFEVLEAVGGFGLAKANANNAESVQAASMGLLAHLSGKDLAIDQSLDAAGYRTALSEKLGKLDKLGDQAGAGRAWEALTDKERTEATAFFGSILGELAELKLGRRSYEALSSATSSALSTTHDVYVQMRADWLFDDSWGKAQAVPFQQLSKDLKDADMPPFLFALEAMVRSAEGEARAQPVSIAARLGEEPSQNRQLDMQDAAKAR